MTAFKLERLKVCAPAVRDVVPAEEALWPIYGEVASTVPQLKDFVGGAFFAVDSAPSGAVAASQPSILVVAAALNSWTVLALRRSDYLLARSISLLLSTGQCSTARSRASISVLDEEASESDFAQPFTVYFEPKLAEALRDVVARCLRLRPESPLGWIGRELGQGRAA